MRGANDIKEKMKKKGCTLPQSIKKHYRKYPKYRKYYEVWIQRLRDCSSFPDAALKKISDNNREENGIYLTRTSKFF